MWDDAARDYGATIIFKQDSNKVEDSNKALP
jgi:hypothetical protein